MILTDGKKKISLEEFMQLPYERAELINGVAYVNEEASPSYEHQSSAVKIVAKLLARLAETGKGELLFAPLDVYLGETVLQPDLLFIAEANKSIIHSDGLHGAPDVIFEIVSPTNAHHDLKVKFDIYEKYGVKEYFIVYPEDKTVVKYFLCEGKYHEQYREQAFIKSEIIDCKFNF
ncbi:MAG TPA: Uma2 family endonuclease [Chitinophagales bacterium]|nr:Uma2 family endonuclease [Chitinophagales bacterium]